MLVKQEDSLNKLFPVKPKHFHLVYLLSYSISVINEYPLNRVIHVFEVGKSLIVSQENIPFKKIDLVRQVCNSCRRGYEQRRVKD